MAKPQKPNPNARIVAAKVSKSLRLLRKFAKEDAAFQMNYQAWLQKTVAAVYQDSWLLEEDSAAVKVFIKRKEVLALPRTPANGRRIYNAQLHLAFKKPKKASAIWKATERFHQERMPPETFRDLLFAHGVYGAAEKHYGKAKERDGDINQALSDQSEDDDQILLDDQRLDLDDAVKEQEVGERRHLVGDHETSLDRSASVALDCGYLALDLSKGHKKVGDRLTADLEVTDLLMCDETTQEVFVVIRKAY